MQCASRWRKETQRGISAVREGGEGGTKEVGMAVKSRLKKQAEDGEASLDADKWR